MFANLKAGQDVTGVFWEVGLRDGHWHTWYKNQCDKSGQQHQIIKEYKRAILKYYFAKYPKSDDFCMHKYQSRTTLVSLYLLSQQGISFLLLLPLLGYSCYSFYAIGEVPFGGRTGHIYFHKDSDPFLFWLVWLVFFACFLTFCALFIDQFYKRTRRVTELRQKPYQ